MGRSKNITTSMGEFIYIGCNPDYYPIGVNIKDCNGYSYMIASPEKALCDLIANSSKVNLRFLKDVENYLVHDIRMDMDEFYKFDATIFEEYIKVGKKADSIATVLKFLRR